MNKIIIFLLSLYSTYAFSQVYIDAPGQNLTAPPPPGTGGGPVTPGTPASSIDMYFPLLFALAIYIIYCNRHKIILKKYE